MVQLLPVGAALDHFEYFNTSYVMVQHSSNKSLTTCSFYFNTSYVMVQQ